MLIGGLLKSKTFHPEFDPVFDKNKKLLTSKEKQIDLLTK